MRYEVEQKFRVESLAEMERGLAQRGVQLGPPIQQIDCYFSHPARDFALTDEAFRVRRTGDQNSVAYKGPKVDPTTKTRREMDLPLPDGEDYYQRFVALLEELGFCPAGEVVKRRRKSFIDWEGVRIEVSLDDVAGLGSYVELELIADESEVAAARQTLAKLAADLGLIHNQRRSYLELLQGGSQAEPGN